jgi:mRNA-degrading endonuclease RelE of RelBE toxin-antitoxin system
MSPNPSHKWLLNIQNNAQDRFNRLTTVEKRIISRQLRELLLADDPNTLPFVEMLQAKKFNRIRKFRAGNYRVFFALEIGEIIHQGHTYKGTFFLLDIRDRQEAY